MRPLLPDTRAKRLPFNRSMIRNVVKGYIDTLRILLIRPILSITLSANMLISVRPHQALTDQDLTELRSELSINILTVAVGSDCNQRRNVGHHSLEGKYKTKGF